MNRNSPGRLRVQGIFSNVAIIALNSFIWPKGPLQSKLEDRDVGPITTWEGSPDPDNAAGDYADADLMSKTR